MKTKERLVDFAHPTVKETARRLTAGATTDRERLERLFYFVRDEIKFAFPKEGDLVKASETLASGKGQCNTKGVLFLALCRAAGMRARIHFSLIRKEIQRGLFVGLLYRIMPDLISHGWLEVFVEGKWRRIDSYINDEPFYLAGRDELKRRGWDTGFSISCSKGESSTDFDIDRERFVQMDAVVEDQGVWDDPEDYFASGDYKNRPGALKLFLYGLVVGRVNKRVEGLRGRCLSGLSGLPSADGAGMDRIVCDVTDTSARAGKRTPRSRFGRFD
jgi:hypothetical protein